MRPDQRGLKDKLRIIVANGITCEIGFLRGTKTNVQITLDATGLLARAIGNLQVCSVGAAGKLIHLHTKSWTRHFYFRETVAFSKGKPRQRDHHQIEGSCKQRPKSSVPWSIILWKRYRDMTFSTVKSLACRNP